MAYLKDGVPIEKTVRECTDIRKFIQVRAVKGGAVYFDPLAPAVGDHIESSYLGKAVRWYYGSNLDGYIAYKSNGNKVAGSQGATPCMQLPTEFPNDVNYSHYVVEAHEMLADVGIEVRYWYHPESDCCFVDDACSRARKVRRNHQSPIQEKEMTMHDYRDLEHFVLRPDETLILRPRKILSLDQLERMAITSTRSWATRAAVANS